MGNAMRWTEEALAAFEKKTEKWKEKGQTRTHALDGMRGVDIDRVHRKFGNQPTDGFPSKREAKRHQELSLLEKAGKISELKRQVPFEFIVKGHKVCRYIADFTYVENGKPVVEDAKGFVTQVFRIKARLMQACFGIEVKLT